MNIANTYQDGEYTVTKYGNGTIVREITPNMATTPKSQFTHQEMYDKFLDTELTAIYTAAQTNVQVAIWLDRFKTAPYIDVTDPRTIKGFHDLETAGLLATGRAEEVLG